MYVIDFYFRYIYIKFNVKIFNRVCKLSCTKFFKIKSVYGGKSISAMTCELLNISSKYCYFGNINNIIVLRLISSRNCEIIYFKN